MLKAGGRAGDYIWHSSTGWHLRATHPGTAKVIFSGRIVSTSPITVRPYRLEAGDAAPPQRRQADIDVPIRELRPPRRLRLQDGLCTETRLQRRHGRHRSCPSVASGSATTGSIPSRTHSRSGARASSWLHAARGRDRPGARRCGRSRSALRAPAARRNPLATRGYADRGRGRILPSDPRKRVRGQEQRSSTQHRTPLTTDARTRRDRAGYREEFSFSCTTTRI